MPYNGFFREVQDAVRRFTDFNCSDTYNCVLQLVQHGHCEIFADITFCRYVLQLDRKINAYVLHILPTSYTAINIFCSKL